MTTSPHSKITKLLTLLMVLGLSFAGMKSIAKELDLDFTIHNETGVKIHKLYVSPHSSDDWEENLLEEPLADGEEIDITFSPKATAKTWDIRVEDADGNAIEWDNLKLTEITDVILKYKNGKATAELKNGDE